MQYKKMKIMTSKTQNVGGSINAAIQDTFKVKVLLTENNCHNSKVFYVSLIVATKQKPTVDAHVCN